MGSASGILFLQGVSTCFCYCSSDATSTSLLMCHSWFRHRGYDVTILGVYKLQNGSLSTCLRLLEMA